MSRNILGNKSIFEINVIKQFMNFRYLPVMKEFVSGASVRLAELEDLFVDMKARVRQKF